MAADTRESGRGPDCSQRLVMVVSQYCNVVVETFGFRIATREMSMSFTAAAPMEDMTFMDASGTTCKRVHRKYIRETMSGDP